MELTTTYDASSFSANHSASRHRYLRSTRQQEYIIPSPRIARDGLYISEALILGIRQGAIAAKRNTIPAIATLTLMLLLTIAYYTVPTVGNAFDELSRIKKETGPLFAFLVSGTCIGILSETMRVLTTKDRFSAKTSLLNFLFLFLAFGILSSIKDPVYWLLSEQFGENNAPGTIIKKVLFDQLVWTVFIACPYQSFLFTWKSHQFSFDNFRLSYPNASEFLTRKTVPVLVSNWVFWVPMITIIFIFPTRLQLVVSIIAISLWVCMLSMLTSSPKTKNEART
ncbi:Mpv17/PMP22 family protein [Cerasicoccus frondis]|uniref:Mpv17/PMP22 family protein n=1 Tax=Cerasicoccus frondis TaxID=490090 RepID=UPI002852505C|nr:Mpv17/PMP22 family protein [Cerasicoccus frondis]